MRDGLGWRAAGAAVGLSAGAARQRWYKWLTEARQQARAADQGQDAPVADPAAAVLRQAADRLAPRCVHLYDINWPSVRSSHIQFPFT